MSPFTILCAGHDESSTPFPDDFTSAIASLRACIDKTIEDLGTLISEGPTSARLVRYGPFTTRRLIEEAVAVMIGRFDPARIVVAMRGARSSDFKLGDQNHSSLGWSRDVLPEFRVEGGLTVWSQANVKKFGVVRSPIDGHLGNYVFEAAHPKVLDALNEKYAGKADLRQWVLHVQRFDDQQGTVLLSDLRRKLAEAYSFLSKGIHFEFSTDGSASLDVMDLAAQIADALQVLTTCALYSHFANGGLCRLANHEAIDAFDSVAARFSL